MYNKDFYPTPASLAQRMVFKIKDLDKVKTLLEPSAGKGDLLAPVLDHFRGYRGDYRHNTPNIHAIEIEPDLRTVLESKEKVSVVDHDFLSYQGRTHFDLILANFPFSNAEHHLKKALDMLFCGQLVCLVNAQLIKNPHTNLRKELVNRLDKLGAEIEYIADAFIDAERQTGVEVALISVTIKGDVESDLFEQMDEDSSSQVDQHAESINEDKTHEVGTRHHYRDLVASFERTCEDVSTQLFEFYRNYHRVSDYLKLTITSPFGEKDDHAPCGYHEDRSLTQIMRDQHNALISRVKESYWSKVTQLPSISRHLTSKQLQVFHANREQFLAKEFNERNIRQFACNLVVQFPKFIQQAIVDLFDRITSHALRDYGWGHDDLSANIHYFNAWKTNKGYKVNRKFILPSCVENDIWGRTPAYLSQSGRDFLTDLGKVASYFMPSSIKQEDEKSLAEICNQALSEGVTRKIQTPYFDISCFKKGTMHVVFKDLDLLRRFNITACQGKAFLPMDYAQQAYRDLNTAERHVVDEFEGKAKYRPTPNILQLVNPSEIGRLVQLSDDLDHQQSQQEVAA